jgi:hypothetical protein
LIRRVRLNDFEWDSGWGESHKKEKKSHPVSFLEFLFYSIGDEKSRKRKILLFLNIIFNTISQHQQTLLRREKIWSRQIYDVTCTFYLSRLFRARWPYNTRNRTEKKMMMMFLYLFMYGILGYWIPLKEEEKEKIRPTLLCA